MKITQIEEVKEDIVVEFKNKKLEISPELQEKINKNW